MIVISKLLKRRHFGLPSCEKSPILLTLAVTLIIVNLCQLLYFAPVPVWLCFVTGWNKDRSVFSSGCWGLIPVWYTIYGCEIPVLPLHSVPCLCVARITCNTRLCRFASCHGFWFLSPIETPIPSWRVDFHEKNHKNEWWLIVVIWFWFSVTSKCCCM